MNYPFRLGREEKNLSYYGSMDTRIRLKNIQLYGWHGVADKEKKMGQQFEIDVEVSLDCNQAISKDDISKTVDYSLIYDFVVSKFSSKKYNLIEALAGDIAQSLTQEFTLENCKVIIRKPDAPINGILDTVEAEVTYHA